MKSFKEFWLLLMLCACSTDPQSVNLRQQLTPEVVSQLQIKVMLVEVPKLKAAALLGIEKETEDTVTWRSLQGQTLSTKQGVLISTRGLVYDLMGRNLEIAPTDVFSSQENVSGLVRSYSYLDGENRILSDSYVCNYSVGRKEEIRRLNGIKTFSSVVESCKNSEIYFENKYYYEDDGEMVASEQWVGRQLEYARLEYIN